MQSGAELSLTLEPLKQQSLQAPTYVNLDLANEQGDITWENTGTKEDKNLRLTRLREVCRGVRDPTDTTRQRGGRLQAAVYT